MYFTYIIESASSKKWYYGHTAEPERRLTEHNNGQNKSTKNKGPWKIIFLRSFDTKQEANRFELELKRIRNKSYIKKKFSAFFI